MLHLREIGRVVGQRAGCAMQQGQLREHAAQILQGCIQRNATFGQATRLIQQTIAVLRSQCGQQIEQIIAPHRAEHRFHRGRFDLAATVGDGLIGQRQGIAHTARRRARDLVQRGGFSLNFFLRQHFAQMLRDQRGRHRLQIELQTTRQHRHRNFLRVGRGEDEFDVRGRLFQRFQHRIERRLGQHVYFVDDVDFIAPHRRRVLRVVEHFAHVVDTGVRRGVEFQ